MNNIPDSNGYYGCYGGAYIPELLYPNIEELSQNYMKIINSSDFQNEYLQLLRDYVGRPSPLYFAKNISKKYNANIYIKREDLNHTGSHKINNTLGQILLAKKLGKTRIIAETGAGQHGVATATVCALYGLKCVIYMGETDIKRQEANVKKIEMLGAKVKSVDTGSKTLKDATNEAIRDWINNPEDTFYIIGSVVGPHPYPHIVSHLQSVISYELKHQLKEKINNPNPDIIICCIGGGSNAAGSFFHYIDNTDVQLIAAEGAGKGINSNYTAATIAKGKKGIIHGAKTMLLQDEDGQIQEAYSISAGLDYPGIGPMFAHLNQINRVIFYSITDDEALNAAFMLIQNEGVIPAIESAHAFAVLEKHDIKHKNIVITLSGRGDKDLNTYINFFEKYGK